MNLNFLIADTIVENGFNATHTLVGSNWLYFIIGGIIVVGGIVIVAYYRKKNKNISFEEYCFRCEKASEPFDKTSDDVIKTVLLLEKIDDNNVAPFLYKRHKDGKITKLQIKTNTFPLSLCPEDVQNTINKDSKGSYIIKH